MSSVNKAIIIGNLGADPEVRYTASDTAVCNLRIATSDRWKGKDGEMNESTEWHSVVVFGRQAENCGEYLSKGRKVYVEGRIQTRKWEDREGNDRYTTEIVAQSVQFLGGRDDAGGGPSYDSSYDQTRKSSGGGGGGGGRKSGGGGGGGNDFNQSFDDDDIPF